jgi:uncharacterized membrane protein
MPDVSPQAVHDIQLYGAGAFGAVIGWYIYYINRHRRDDVTATDLVTLIGIIGGTAVLALFPAHSDLFGAYGIGLAIGFFGYFVIMMILVVISRNFGVDYFLDGRRKKPTGNDYIPTRDEARANVPAAMEPARPSARTAESPPEQ